MEGFYAISRRGVKVLEGVAADIAQKGPKERKGRRSGFFFFMRFAATFAAFVALFAVSSFFRNGLR